MKKLKLSWELLSSKRFTTIIFELTEECLIIETQRLALVTFADIKSGKYFKLTNNLDYQPL